MTGNEIRKRFLKYFQEHGHAIIDSSPLVPHNDPTLLFTNAGMVQFKRVFMGEEQRDYARAASCQSCVRAGGKHNDLENVGHTARHHTYFEMLGNFSFGDYFKKEAIEFAWEFLTKEMGLPKEKLWVSVFQDDDEAFSLWQQIEDLPTSRIIRLGEADNFWAMGDTGPCGPCSEIHIDQGPEVGCGSPDCSVGCDCDRYLELWNLVFMQFYRDETGKMTKLPKPSIDTGMGLERIAAVLQGKTNNFESDLFSPIIDHIATRANKKYGQSLKDDVAMRVIADHGRATVFLVADGVLPSNEGRGYVLRRIMRRAIRFGKTLELEGHFFDRVCQLISELMLEAYPHLSESKKLLEKVTSNEEARFGETLDNGLMMLDHEIGKIERAQGKSGRINGEFIFKLYDTYGFPVDIVRDVALERGVLIDETGFQKAMEKQRELSRRSWKGEDLEHLAIGIVKLLEQGKKTQFIGYSSTQCTSTIEAILDEQGNTIENAGQGRQVGVITSKTPFYAESGGQCSDNGEILWEDGRFSVKNTRNVTGLIIQEGTVNKGTIRNGMSVTLTVESERRNSTALNHTATHLLHKAMKNILGDHVNQAGSLVDQDRLRFDFTHFSPVTADEIRSIEELVNSEIRSNTPVQTEVMARQSAIENGATALFGEKYGDEVRVVSIGDFSKELCGGTHATATGDIGFLKIISESGIASGVRRIEAVTGKNAVKWVQELARQAETISNVVQGPLDGASEKIKTLLKRQKELENEVANLTAKLAMADLDKFLSKAVQVEGIKVMASEVFLDSPKTLREIGDKVREKMGSGVAVLGGRFGGKAALLALVSKDLTERIKAGTLINKVAGIVGGKGGGRPDMAQAGGPMMDKLSEALQAVPSLIKQLLTN